MTPPETAVATPELKIEKASDFANLDEDQLAAVIGRPKPPPQAAPAEEPLPQTEEVAPEKEEELVAAEKPAETAPAAEKPAAEAEAEVAKPPLTQFQVFDKEGELEIPELTFKFKAVGKERDLPLDKVVQLAQMGFYNEEREQQVLAGKQFVAEAQQQLDDAKALADQYEGYYGRLFENPEFYDQARAAWLQQNSPEARASRAEAQLAETHRQQQLAVEDAQLGSFVQHELTPTVERLLADNPSVSFDEVMGRYMLLTSPLLVRGRLPLNRLPAVKQTVENELAQWVRERQGERGAQERATEAKVTAAKTETTLAKRKVARAVAPPTTSAPAQPPPKKFATSREWLDATLPLPQED